MSGGRNLLYTNVRAGHDAALEKSLGMLPFRGFPLAAGEGFEPSQTESESGVLPLHKPAIARSPLTISQAHILLYAELRKCQEKLCGI